MIRPHDLTLSSAEALLEAALSPAGGEEDEWAARAFW